MDQNTKDSIKKLQNEPHFNHVDWEKVTSDLDLFNSMRKEMKQLREAEKLASTAKVNPLEESAE